MRLMNGQHAGGGQTGNAVFELMGEFK